MNTTASNNTSSTVTSLFDTPAMERLHRWRRLKDKIARHGMTVGGSSVIVAVVLIFFYLLYVVFPLLLPARMEAVKQYALPVAEAGESLYIMTEERGEIGVRYTVTGQVVFFDVATGQHLQTQKITLPDGVSISSFNTADFTSNAVAFGLSNGQALVVEASFKVSFGENNARSVETALRYPMEQAPIVVDPKGHALLTIAVQVGSDANTIAAVTDDNRLVLTGVTKQKNFMTDEMTLQSVNGEIALSQTGKVEHLLIDKEQRVAYLADINGVILRINIVEKNAPVIEQSVNALEKGVTVTALAFLNGDISLLVGDSLGRITQWFPVRNEKNESILTRIRFFHEQRTPITSIDIEQRRKGFIAADSDGYVGVYYTTSERVLKIEKVSPAPIKQVALSPRGEVILAEDAKGTISVWHLDNPHPESSMYALWSKVWYESYSKPDYTWQSTSATNDFESKFSLVPLVFGTIKAAFYALLVAIPLSIFGAIYAAYFMSPAMRTVVKPTIEIMEALPTVILGFLAGLWLAPFVESNLPGVLMLLLFLPIAVLVSAYVWHILPKSFTERVPDGWQAGILIPVILFVGWVAFALSHPIEALLFAGDMPHWLTQHGIDFDQRNALVVGIAMGLAVIPNIFSIAEDAIFSVPKHLTSGSLALGATPWQTLIRVVILTASPGIFSAIMIGVGRAVGETMIVLMATGNTPVIDFSIFQGLRTLSANIAVELPESEVNSTHYRVLFLAALFLFLVTFFFNTIAEVIRHRLRKKYSSL
ncbi:ABC transporter permease subunit [Beggiatoa leptomitoformis]|uniref:ABC transporter permease subunit n=1 Tax=Beggiatoa leptomitoformis TaxID=288004 RepID=A0A2N9YHQ1_9GAMM|nr:ABC transporter permease subunit [Beggiatoa leptomitoformis]ALG69409.2 ABC transporter permease subunit [Beggiatoa leptomitoformis]AUI69993.1 ABC transporter permease subunit [Beggiatoa leptomitoformis]